MKFVVIGVLVLLAGWFGFALWKSSKNWRWYHMLVATITMILAVLLLFPTAGVLKSRSAWHKVKEDLEVRAAKVKLDQEAIKFGDATNPAVGEGLSAISQRLSKLGIEAGRRWRSLGMKDNANSQVTLVQVAAPAEGGEAAPAAAADGPLVPTGLVVYGFAETPLPEEEILVPTFYLGEFRVISSRPDQVVLAPTGPLAPAQNQAIESGRARSWSLYEMLPLDSHEPFIAEGSVPNEDNYLGRIDEELVNRLLGKSVSPGTLKAYLEDGRRAQDSDPPLSRWTKIEFLKPWTIDVDTQDQRGALDGGFFDVTGRAVDGRLQRGEEGKIVFSKADQILLKESEADRLIDEGVAKLVDRYFLRPMNDYRFILRHIQLRLADLANRQAELEFAEKVLKEAIEKSNAMLVINQEIKVKLEQDLDQFSVEHKAIEDHRSKVAKELDVMKAEMSRLYKDNLRLEQRINDIHQSVRNGSTLTGVR